MDDGDDNQSSILTDEEMDFMADMDEDDPSGILTNDDMSFIADMDEDEIDIPSDISVRSPLI